MDIEVANPKHLRRRVIRWTAVMWTLIASSLADLAIYLPDARAGHAVLKPHENVILFIGAGVLIVLAYLARREAKGELRLTHLETALIVLQATIAAVQATLVDDEKARSHRDGRLYQGTFRAQKELVRIRRKVEEEERPTQPLPRAVGGTYASARALASVPSAAESDNVIAFELGRATERAVKKEHSSWT